MKLWKTIVSVTAIIGLTAASVAYMFQVDDTVELAKAAEPIWDVRTMTATAGAYRPQIKLIGQIEPLRDITEAAQLSARVIAVLKSDGARVSQGELIVQLDDFDTKQQVLQGQADLAQIETQLKLQQSQQQLDRHVLSIEKAQLSLLQARLQQQQAISQTQQALEDQKLIIERQALVLSQTETLVANHALNQQQLELQKQQSQLRLNSAQRALEHTRVRAPFAGKLAQVQVKAGQRVSPGQALFRIYSAEAMNIKVQLPTRLLATPERLSGSIQQQDHFSELAYHHSEAQLRAGQSGFNAWFSLSEPDLWLPGEVADVALRLPSTETTYSVPAVALFQDRWLYRVDAEQRLVALEVKVLGTMLEQGETRLVVAIVTPSVVPIVTPSTVAPTDGDLRLLATRLNYPTTGMKIYELGVDPLPSPTIETGSDRTDSEVPDADV